MTLAGALMAAAATPRGIRAIEHDGTDEWLAYPSLAADALRIGGALRVQGLRPGDRIALVVPEVGTFVRVFFGIQAAGLIAVPLCPPAQAGDVQTFARQSKDILEASRAHAVVTTSEVAGLLATVTNTPILLTTDLTGPALDAPVRVRTDAPALLQFTSGSTAAPKGVVLTHANVAANARAIVGAHGLGVHADDVGVSWLPLYHDMGLIGMMLATVFAQATTVLMSPVLFLKRPTAWLDAISRYRGTISFAPNFAYELCLRRVKDSQIAALDLSSWRAAGCGAEPIRAETLHAFAERFARAGFRASSFLPSYGLAEHCLAVTFAGHGIEVDTIDAARLVRDSVASPAVNGAAAVRLVSCGRAFPDHELRIVDEAGRPLPDRHVGSIVVRGPSMMREYFDAPEATAETIVDGWLWTGDLGYLVDGNLFVCGRTKDLIVRQGRKYHPADLESAIADLPGVRPSGIVVFGINHPNEADRVVAVLEARATAPESVVDDVRRRVRETAGLDLDQIVVAPPGTIPRTTSGKVRRAETRARYQAGTLGTGRIADRERA